jgi:hypothetical protein
VLWLDLGAFEQRVEHREADRVRFGAGADRTGDPGLGFGEPLVGAAPVLAGCLCEVDLAGVAGGVERFCERAVEAGAVERVGVAAFGQQADAAAAEQQEAVEQPVRELDGVDVMTQLGGGDVADHADVRVGRARGRGPGQDLQGPAVPRRAQGRRQRRDLAADRLEHADELGLDHQQPPVAGARILAGGVADRPDQPLPAAEAGQDPAADRSVSAGDQSLHVIPR